MKQYFPQRHGIRLKKEYGQHFLQDEGILQRMLEPLTFSASIPIAEIGCGDGALTRHILQHSADSLTIFEIDPEWAAHVSSEYLATASYPTQMVNASVLDCADTITQSGKNNWIIVGNLPYNVTFPILKWLVRLKEHCSAAAFMVQEEVAQRVVATGGRDLGAVSVFLQHHCTWQLGEKIPPSAFYPAPKVQSRILYAYPKVSPVIPNEEKYWRFVEMLFKFPRRTIRNNLKAGCLPTEGFDAEILDLRSQQLSTDQFLKLWLGIQSA